MPENIEILYDIIVNIHFIFMQFFVAVCLYVLCKNFMANKKGALFTGGVYFFVCIGLYYMPFFIGNFEAYLFALFAAFIITICIEKRNIKMKIFLFVTFYAVRWVTISLADLVNTVFINFMERIISNYIDLSNPDIWKYAFIKDCAVSILDCLFTGICLLFIVKKISKVFVYKQKEMDIKELIFLIIPSLSGMILYKIFNMYYDILQNEVNLSVLNSYSFIQFLWNLSQFITLLSIIITIVFYQNIKKKQEEENMRIMLENEIKDMQFHIKEVEKIYTEIRGVKHDINNHINIIGNLLEQKNINEAINYLKPLQKTTEILDFSVKTGNPVTDVIIHEKIKEAKELGINFTSDFSYPKDVNINAFDVSVILLNALSNAMEAVSPRGFITISSYRNKNAYLIIVENSYYGCLNIDEESKLPKTRKSDKKSHGLGMQNMKAIAQKYYGDILIKQEENKVILTIMLMVYK